MDFSSQVEETKCELQIAPLIDVVFLLLIYFIMTAQLIKKEANIKFMLPAPADPSTVTVMPVEVLIQLTPEGAVEVDGIQYPQNDRNLNDLVERLKSQKKLADAQNTKFYVNLLPSHETAHYRVIDVMDACAAAGVQNLSFSKAAM